MESQCRRCEVNFFSKELVDALGLGKIAPQARDYNGGPLDEDFWIAVWCVWRGPSGVGSLGGKFKKETKLSPQHFSKRGVKPKWDRTPCDGVLQIFPVSLYL